MKILALELSSALGSIALAEDGRELFESSFTNDRKHSGLFFENLEGVLKRHGNPDRIVVGLGPGSYAGTRIAIATAIGLRAASRADLVGVASVAAVETEAPEYFVIGDARRQTFYFAHVRARRCVRGPELCTAEEIAARLQAKAVPVFSTESLRSVPQATIAFPSARILTSIAGANSEQLIREPLEPIYLRAPHVTHPKARQNLTAHA